jgi:YVTN family beta-propeller protein
MNMKTRTLTKLQIMACCLLLAFFVIAGGAPAGSATAGDASNKPAAIGKQTAPDNEDKKAVPVTDTITRQGISIEFTATPAAGRSMSGEEIFAADYVDMAFRVTDANSGRPLKGQFPGAWMDMSKSWEGDQSLDSSCKERVGSYLSGALGIRPLIDLNSYFILVMNRDNTITVIDPITGVKGITKLYAQINLKQPAADWAKTGDEKWLFVTIPRADTVAVVDTDTFKVTRNIDAGKKPMRIALQPDGRYLWVGNNAEEASESGVTVIDIDKLAVAEFIPTGKGHHEIVFSEDSRTAFVSNRVDGSVSVIDINRLKKIKDIDTGPLPISLDFSSLSKSLYVADSNKGEISVIDGRSFKKVAGISAKPGLGPLRFSQDGRWAVAVNSKEDVAYVIDPATNTIAHTIAVGKQPYQVAFSRSFAYVRSLDTERVSMIDLSELGKPGTVPVVTFGAGAKAPAKAKDISIADAIVEAPGEAAVMVVSPADLTVYYYMEGMNAPMGNFRNYGHMPRAVQVVDRSMQEREPGVYASTVRIPEAGTYEVAFLLDSPSVLHCFEVSARPNPLLEPKGPPVIVEYLNEQRWVKVGEAVRLRFRLTDRRTDKPRTDLKDVLVAYFAAPGGRRTQVAASHTGDGVYEANLPLAKSGAYYVYVASASAKVKFGDLNFMTLVASATGESPRPRRGGVRASSTTGQ